MIVARSRRVFQVVCLLLKCRPTCRYALYAIVMGVVYILGLPLGVFIMLYRRRRKLFGSAAADPVVAATQATYGFLYLGYGPSAWWWEVEELVRKLLLSAVVVLFESGSPLQVCVETMGVLTKLVVPLAVTCISVASHSANISGTVCPPLPTFAFDRLHWQCCGQAGLMSCMRCTNHGVRRPQCTSCSMAACS